ncbi:hypothetical protein GEMRC1_006657 [Eukaryota sp. GEM-RC1]
MSSRAPSYQRSNKKRFIGIAIVVLLLIAIVAVVAVVVLSASDDKNDPEEKDIVYRQVSMTIGSSGFAMNQCQTYQFEIVADYTEHKLYRLEEGTTQCYKDVILPEEDEAQLIEQRLMMLPPKDAEKADTKLVGGKSCQMYKASVTTADETTLSVEWCVADKLVLEVVAHDGSDSHTFC